jgi:hypothetical protein
VEPGEIELVPVAVVLSIRFCVLFSKGVIWLLLTTVAGVVPIVSLASFFVHILFVTPI